MEEVQVFNNESRSELNYTIRANKWLDFSATYTFTDRMGYETAGLCAKVRASLWKANYEILERKQTN